MSQPTFTIGETVIVRRDDRDGDRIPMNYRLYIAEKTYIYKAKILHLNPTKTYFKVEPLPPRDVESNGSHLRRKGYKSKTYKLSHLSITR